MGSRAKLLLVPLLLFVFALQAFVFARRHSNAYDETDYIGAGYSYAETGKFILDMREHPPLLKLLAGLAVRSLHPRLPPFEGGSGGAPSSFRFGYQVLYHGGVPPEDIVFRARLPNMVLGVLLGLAVCLWAGSLLGRPSALAALCLYAFEPSLIAHSGLLSLDFGVAFFGFLAVAFYERCASNDDAKFLILAAASFAAGLLVKISMLLFLPAILAAALARARGPEERLKALRRFAVFVLASCALAFLVLWSLGVSPSSQVRLLTYRWEEVSGGDMSAEPTNFLMGETRQGRFLGYYLAALMVKLTGPFLALLLLASLRWVKDRALRAESLWVALPALAFILAGSLSHKQYGIRYILPALPFLCVWASAFAASARPLTWIAAVLLLGWHAGEALAVSPHYLEYFNEIAGGPDGGYRWLVESNLDWGQDMPELRDYLRASGPAEVITALAGNPDLDYWIGPHQDLVVDPLTAENPFSRVNPPAPARELLLIGATYRMGYGLSQPHAFDWLDSMRPAARVAHSIFVYDVTKDARAHNRMGAIYYGRRQWKLALRECLRARDLAPNSPDVYAPLGDVYAAMGDHAKAGAAYERGRALKRNGIIK